MSYEVVWSEKAEEQFNHVFDYLVEYWSIDVAIRFVIDTRQNPMNPKFY